jgi:hypothetical protein
MTTARMEVRAPAPPLTVGRSRARAGRYVHEYSGETRESAEVFVECVDSTPLHPDEQVKPAPRPHAPCADPPPRGLPGARERVQGCSGPCERLRVRAGRVVWMVGKWSAGSACAGGGARCGGLARGLGVALRRGRAAGERAAGDPVEHHAGLHRGRKGLRHHGRATRPHPQSMPPPLPHAPPLPSTPPTHAPATPPSPPPLCSRRPAPCAAAAAATIGCAARPIPDM